MMQFGNPVDRVKDRWSLSKGSFILEPDPKVKVALLRSGSSATHLAKLSATRSPCRKSQPKTEEWIKNWLCFSHPTNTFKCLAFTVQQSSSKNITFGSMMVYDGRYQFLGHFGALSFAPCDSFRTSNWSHRRACGISTDSVDPQKSQDLGIAKER